MSVLKVTSSRKGYRFVGVSLPPQVFTYLSLFCLAEGIPKSKLLKGFLNSWMKENKDKTESILIKKVVSRIKLTWKGLQKSKCDITFSEYMQQVENDLSDKLPTNIISDILKQMENAANN